MMWGNRFKYYGGDGGEKYKYDGGNENKVCDTNRSKESPDEISGLETDIQRGIEELKGLV